MYYSDWLPKSYEEFNDSLDDIDAYFWGELVFNFSIYCPSDKYFHLIYQVNNYYVFAKLKFPPHVKDDPDGPLSEISAGPDLIEFIRNYDVHFFNRNINTKYLVPESDYIEKSFYYSNYLYVDESYDNVLKTVSDYFYDETSMKPIDSEDYVIKDKTLYDLWDVKKESNYELLYTSSADVDITGSGIMIKVVDTLKALASFDNFSRDHELIGEEGYDFITEKKVSPFDTDLMKPIPGKIYERLNGIPVIVEINFHRGFSRPILGYRFMEDLCKKFDGKAVSISSDYNMMAIKSNKLIPEEDRVYYLYEHIDSYIDSVAMDDGVQMAKERIPNTWALLDENSKKFLATGLFLYDKTIKGSKYILDFSLPSLAFAKCIENEMVQRIIKPYREHYLSNFEEEDMSLDLKDSNLTKTAKYLIGKTSTPPELGSFAYFLQNVINSKKRANWSIAIKSFKSFSESCQDPAFLLNPEMLLKSLLLITTKYRNGSAHIKVLPLEYLKEFHSVLFEDMFIQHFINSTILIDKKSEGE